MCYKKSRGEHITYNAISVPKELLDRKTNDEVLVEGVSFNLSVVISVAYGEL